MRKALQSSEMPVTIYQSTWYIPKIYAFSNTSVRTSNLTRKVQSEQNTVRVVSKIIVKYVCLSPFTFQQSVLYCTAMAAYFYIVVIMSKFCHPSHYLNTICIMACFLSDHNLYVSENSLRIGLEN